MQLANKKTYIFKIFTASVLNNHETSSNKLDDVLPPPYPLPYLKALIRLP